MLHVVTEVGKPGRKERQRRHFPGKTNQASDERCEPRGRRYIPHGSGEDYEFTPHNAHVEPEYTDCGPDWSSRRRYIPSPHNPEYITEIWPDEWKSIRVYPWMSRKTTKEWSLYPEGYDVAKKCTFQGVHKATANSSTEISHSMRFGKGRLVVDKRNGISMASPGDKSYQAVEYSPSFHKFGSTLPLVNFGGDYLSRPETFVPLQELPPIRRATFKEREKERRKLQEHCEVQSLDTWRPATPLQPVNANHPLPVAQSVGVVQE